MKLVNKLYQRGVTLFEVLLVLFVGAFIAVGVTVIYTRAVNSVASNQLNSDIQQLAASIHSLYSSTGNYSLVSTSIALTVAPADLVSSAGAPTTPAFVTGASTTSGTWTVGAGNANGNFTITVSSIPTSACASLVGFALQAGAISANALTEPGAAAAACGSPGTATLIFQ